MTDNYDLIRNRDFTDKTDQTPVIIYISDASVRGSGYSTIMRYTCENIVQSHNHKVIVLGLDYYGEEHWNSFTIVPVISFSAIQDMVFQIVSYRIPVECVVIALDITMQEVLIPRIREKLGYDIPIVSIFPIESGPLIAKWAMVLMQANERVVMSEFGKQALLNSGSDGHHIPFGIDFSIWREPIENEREKMRQVLGIDDDTFVILTVADNQERKNLDAAFNIVSKFAVDIEERNQNGFVTKKTNKRKVKWILVTRLQSNIGWDLTDLPSRYGIQDILVLYERGIPVKNLWGLYIISDIFLLTSKAEGLAIPILEAMATGLLCVATNFAAMHEHLTDDRGYLIDTDYHWFDVFGNSERVLVDIEDGVKKLEMVYNESDQEKNTIRERALEYVKKRTWEKSTQMLIDVIDKVKGNS